MPPIVRCVHRVRRPATLAAVEGVPSGPISTFYWTTWPDKSSSRSVILKRLITLYICWDSNRETACWRVCPVIIIGHSVPINVNMKFNTIVDSRCVGRDKSVGIATWRAGRSGDRILVRARFSAPVQTDSCAQPASYTMGTGSFPGVKRPGRGVDHPPDLAPMLKKE